MAKMPTSTQASMARPKSGTSLATAYGFLKTPEPMTVPMTMAVAIHGPRTRGRRSEAVEFMANSLQGRRVECPHFVAFRSAKGRSFAERKTKKGTGERAQILRRHHSSKNLIVSLSLPCRDHEGASGAEE